MAHHTEAEAVEADIRDTQARIDRTIDAIKAKLSPHQLMDHGVAYLKEHGGEITRNAGRKVAENPLPVALMASALAWLMIADGRSKASHGRAEDERTKADKDRNWNIAPEYSAHRDALSLHDRVSKAVSDVQQGANESWESFTDRIHDARATAMGVVRNAGEDLAAFRERVSSSFADLTLRVGKAKDAMSSHFGDLGAAAAHAAGATTRFASDTAGRVGGKAQELFNDQPLVVGAIGAALGALAGALIPKTATEDSVLGEAGSALRRTAADMAQSARDRVEDAAEQVGRVVTDAAEQEGLTIESVKAKATGFVEKAERLAERTIEAVEKEADGALRQSR